MITTKAISITSVGPSPTAISNKNVPQAQFMSEAQFMAYANSCPQGNSFSVQAVDEVSTVSIFLRYFGRTQFAPTVLYVIFSLCDSRKHLYNFCDILDSRGRLSLQLLSVFRYVTTKNTSIIFAVSRDADRFLRKQSSPTIIE